MEIKPQENTLLEGLYKSSGIYCSQCEAHGFRGITFFPDRPDVMTKYTVRIEADKVTVPVLLSNGNLTESGDLDGGRHFAVYVDPWKKPCYLFCVVAGDLMNIEGVFTTMGGRKVLVRVFTTENNIEKVDWALACAMRAMKWDEDKFGREYDLDFLSFVCVDDFNMGAMENKSLIVFNSAAILATPKQSSDGRYVKVENVIAHEYFHNWTGNRVTVRDWFQVTLKEGLTNYRDQEYTSDRYSRIAERIGHAMAITTRQFREDAGAMAHPIRPDSYIAMDNFYTTTVYEKGAEVIRMYKTLLTVEGFRKGMDLYFERHDGHAVTCDDFLAAMADANGEDLSQFAKWYSQAGTPRVTAKMEQDITAKTVTLTFTQVTPPTPG